ncbi:MAG: hypothetical protein FWB75_06055 [Oscillospiraceae bacterium]|nr:hypothetical protein [Oscillospiraceae bacterium]
MAKRYVPNTYNNKRALRLVLGTIVSVFVLLLALFLVLFFVLEGYLVDGYIDIPWLGYD